MRVMYGERKGFVFFDTQVEKRKDTVGVGIMCYYCNMYALGGLGGVGECVRGC